MGEIVANISGVLALCGIVSFRSFLPTFLLLAIVRFTRDLEGCPQAILDAAAHVPEPMLSNGIITLFFLLAVAELVANWSETMRQLLEDSDFDRYFKPFYAFVFAIVAGTPLAEAIPVQEAASAAASAASAVTSAVSVASAAVTDVVSAAATDAVSAAANAVSAPPAPEEGLPWLAWIWDFIMAGAASFGTAMLCKFRAQVSSAIRSIDPDNSFHLHTLAKFAEETTWVSVLFVALLLPMLAAVIVVFIMLAGAGFRSLLKVVEKQNSHKCADCGEMVHNSAVVCPSCRKEQPLPYRRVGLFALAASSSVNSADAADVLRHHRRLLSAHRCPLCASPLKDGFVCDRCGAKVWEQGLTRRDLIGRLDTLVIGATLAGVFLSAVPIVGFVVAVFMLNLMAIGVIQLYEDRFGRIVSRFIFKVVKWTLLLLAIVLSFLPFMGIMLLVPYVVRYMWLRKRFLAGTGTAGTE